MKIELNLTSAFTLRKRINAIASEIKSKGMYTSLVVEPESLEDTNKIFVTGNLDSDMVLMESAIDAGVELSNEIDKMNVVGKGIMNKIQRINDKVEVYRRMVSSLTQNKLRKERNPVTGVWETRSLVAVSDKDYSERIKELLREKMRLEDELTKYNSSTKFSFDLNDELYTKIYG